MASFRVKTMVSLMSFEFLLGIGLLLLTGLLGVITQGFIFSGMQFKKYNVSLICYNHNQLSC